MDFQVVVLAGGTSKNLVPLVSKDVPKALLPVANRPVLSYVLELLESSNLKDLIVVVEGKENAIRVGGWISNAYVDRLHVEVADVPEDVGTAGALRSVAHYLTASDILVVSGDLVCDVPPGAVAATHRRHNAAVTALLCSVPIGGHSETGGSGGKDKAKKPARHNIIGLDPTKQFLLNVTTGADVHKDLRISKTNLRASGQMEIWSDLMDAHLYAFKRAPLLDILDQNPAFHSIKQDVVPYLVKSQLSLKSEVPANGTSQMEEGLNKGAAAQTDPLWYTQRQMGPISTFDNLVTGYSHDFYPVLRAHKCCAYIASEKKYCVRLNSIQAFCDVNRDVIGDASRLSGYSFSAQYNIIHPSAELGNKTTVGPNCMLGEGSQLGDKCSVKRSVIGSHCRIGSNVKIANSVVMNYVTIEDGCSIQGSVICSNVHLHERVLLKDCQVGAGYVITSGNEYKSESLARKEK